MASSLLTVAPCDLSQASEVAELVYNHPGILHLIHLSACISSPHRGDYYRHNLEATVHLLGHLRPSLQSIVYVSTFDVYAIPSPCPISEEASTTPETYYGASKLSAEKYLQLSALDSGVRPAILRCSSIYGPGQTIGRAMTFFLAQAARHQPLVLHGDGGEKRDYIYVEDAAQAVELCYDKRAAGVFNLGGGTPTSVRHLAELAIQVSQSRSSIDFRPRHKDCYDLYLDIGKIYHSLGFVPATSLEAGMRLEAESLAHSLR